MRNLHSARCAGKVKRKILIDDPRSGRIRNEIKKNKPYHLAHTEAVGFFIKNSTYLARLRRFILTPAASETEEEKNCQKERDGHAYNTKIIIANCTWINTVDSLSSVLLLSSMESGCRSGRRGVCVCGVDWMIYIHGALTNTISDRSEENRRKRCDEFHCWFDPVRRTVAKLVHSTRAADLDIFGKRIDCSLVSNYFLFLSWSGKVQINFV